MHKNAPAAPQMMSSFFVKSDFLLLSNGVTEGPCSVITANKNQSLLNKAYSVSPLYSSETLNLSKSHKALNFAISQWCKKPATAVSKEMIETLHFSLS